MNFEPVLKGTVVSLFDLYAQQYSRKPGGYWGPISYQVPVILWSASKSKSKRHGGIDKISLQCC